MQAKTGRVRGVISEFFGGFVVLGRGFAFWRRRPGLMALGLLPAALVGLGMIALLVTLAWNLQRIGITVTGFADNWDPIATGVLRVIVAIAIFAGALVLSAFAFTAVTLIAGEPVYAKIWREVELALGDFPEAKEPGFWRSVGDAGRLVLQAIVLAIVVGILGLIPYVGPPIAAVLAFLLSGRIIALELTARPLEARGMTREQRKAVLRTRNPRLIGFGVAVHFFYGIPLGAVLVMPAAVVGATILARHAIETHGGLQFDADVAGTLPTQAAATEVAGFETPAPQAPQPAEGSDS